MTFEQKIQAGSIPLVGKKILHTAPHHDDILLGYFPYVVRNLQGNEHHILYLTSGANGVSDKFLAQHQNISLQAIQDLDHATKQELKSQIRESESAKKWAIVGQGQQIFIKNLRAAFYTSYQISHKTLDSWQQDLQRLVDYLHEVQPDIITVLVDEAGCGPQTHHQAADLMLAAVEQYQKMTERNPLVLAYRNIWSSFTPQQATMIISVNEAELKLVESVFQQCFASQHNKLIMHPDSDPHDLTTWKNFAQQATAMIREQNMQIYMQAIDESLLT